MEFILRPETDSCSYAADTEIWHGWWIFKLCDVGSFLLHCILPSLLAYDSICNLCSLYTCRSCLHGVSWFYASFGTSSPLTSTCPHLRCDVGLEEGELFLCYSIDSLCIITFVHSGMNSSYTLVDWIRLLSCLIYLFTFWASLYFWTSWYIYLIFLLHSLVYRLVSWAWWNWPLTWLTNSNRCPSATLLVLVDL